MFSPPPWRCAAHRNPAVCLSGPSAFFVTLLQPRRLCVWPGRLSAVPVCRHSAFMLSFGLPSRRFPLFSSSFPAFRLLVFCLSPLPSCPQPPPLVSADAADRPEGGAGRRASAENTPCGSAGRMATIPVIGFRSGACFTPPLSGLNAGI